MEPDRKLTTILSADVAGYSRLMGADEAGTLATLKACREAFAGLIPRYRGRIVGQAGDSVLAEFPSVVLAVECAVRLQREIAERNTALAEERRMRFRIGINLGDVMVEGDDLFGEGVNIAARLQALAEPGGILISGSVFDQVRNKLSLGFDFLGPQTVKNIAEEVPAYRVVLDGAAPPEFFAQGETTAAERTNDGFRRGLGNSAATVERPPVRGTDASTREPFWGGGPPRPRLPKRERLMRRALIAGVLIALPLAINIFTYQHSGVLWFQWPMLAILFLFALRSIWVWWR